MFFGVLGGYFLVTKVVVRSIPYFVKSDDMHPSVLCLWIYDNSKELLTGYCLDNIISKIELFNLFKYLRPSGH